MVIFMQKLVECRLIVNSEINGIVDNIVVSGKGYCKMEDKGTVVYFMDNDMKYKYVYNGNELCVYCNASFYKFIVNKNSVGKIKNGDYIFEVTTFATKIEINNNLIILEYNLSQDGSIIGKYKSQLSF